MSGRSITDNIMIAYECLHYLKRKYSGDKGYAALKLDVSKAYDSLDWNYLRDIMITLGFDYY